MQLPATVRHTRRRRLHVFFEQKGENGKREDSMKLSNEKNSGRKGRCRLLWEICGIIAAAALASGFVVACSRTKTVGREIALQDITEFVYTAASSSYPPDYQRYRFYTADGKHMFCHETREGFHWPLTEEDITASGTMELTQREWEVFLRCLQGGTVKRKKQSVDAGGSDPWLYLYWNGERSRCGRYSFASHGDVSAFSTLCAELAAGQSK